MLASLRVVHLPSSKQTTVLWKWLAVSRKTKGSTGSLLRIHHLQLVDGVPTFMFTNTPKELEDREEVDEDGNPMYVKVLGEVDGEPAMVDSDERLVTKGLKSQFIAQAKDSANKALAATDWYVIRKAERDVAIPAEVVAERQAIIDACTAKEAAITAATTIEGLMTAVQGG
jgi:hypothetical protein